MGPCVCPARTPRAASTMPAAITAGQIARLSFAIIIEFIGPHTVYYVGRETGLPCCRERGNRGAGAVYVVHGSYTDGTRARRVSGVSARRMHRMLNCIYFPLEDS